MLTFVPRMRSDAAAEKKAHNQSIIITKRQHHMKLSKLMLTGAIACGLLSLNSCGKKTYMAAFSPEETGLNVVKITDESKIPVYGPTSFGYFMTKSGVGNSRYGASKKNGMLWSTSRLLSISPDGEELAYLTGNEKTRNIMIRRAGTGGTATQRTTRQTSDLVWGADDNLYFSDISADQSKMCVMNAHKGTLMRQLTSNNYDSSPALSPDGKKIFFTRTEGRNGPAIWSYDLKSGELTNCSRGFQPTPISGEEFLCVRNNDNGTSEIWRVNFVNGQETLLLSDENRGYTHPTLSPDGEWLLVVGDTKSNINKTKNLDIFAVRLDGSNMIQLTHHPATDTCPQWSKDGKSIYFLSTRANKDEKFNIWRMNFKLY